MDETYLHRLSRPYRQADGAPQSDDGAEHPLGVVPGAPGPESGSEPERRRRVAACEVCGRTLLAGEQTREIVVGERVAAACPLCVIGAQHAVRQRAA